MKNKISYLFAFIAFMSAGSLSAANNTIAFIQGTSQPCTYDFRDTTGTRTYTPTSYYWDFGDGSTPVTTQHATHTYAANGTYTVTHMSSDGTNTDTAYLSLTVNCPQNRPLNASFSHYAQDTIDPNKVYFTDQSDGKPVSWLWHFGDGMTSSQQNPVHIYATNVLTQTYTVSLQVYDGSTYDTTYSNVTIKPFDSCATFFAYFNFQNQNDSNCKEILFTNASHWSATNYSWDFGDSSSSSSANPAHRYSRARIYMVKLIASNARCADTIYTRVVVRCRTCYTVNASIVLQVDSTTPGKAILYNYTTGAVASHYWNFGDGQSSTQAAPQHTYTSPGYITLTYVAIDTLNCTDTAILHFQIDSAGNIKRGLLSFSLQVIDRTNGNTSSIKQTDANASRLALYPNPVQSQLNLKNSSMHEMNIVVVNSLGQTITQLSIPGQSVQELDVHLWPAGIYLIKADNGALYTFVKH